MTPNIITPIFIRPNQLKEITGLTRTTVWRLENAGKFPRRRQIGPGCVGWLYAEVETFLKNSTTAQTSD